MTAEKGEFRIELTSDSPQWWRFNVALMGGCFGDDGARTGFASAEDTVAEVGSALGAPPSDYPSPRSSVLVLPSCRQVDLFVYVIPHTLPLDREVEACVPFEADLRVCYGGSPILSRKLQVNQWSGASAELRIDRP